MMMDNKQKSIFGFPVVESDNLPKIGDLKLGGPLIERELSEEGGYLVPDEFAHGYTREGRGLKAFLWRAIGKALDRPDVYARGIRHVLGLIETAKLRGVIRVTLDRTLTPDEIAEIRRKWNEHYSDPT